MAGLLCCSSWLLRHPKHFVFVVLLSTVSMLLAFRYHQYLMADEAYVSNLQARRNLQLPRLYPNRQPDAIVSRPPRNRSHIVECRAVQDDWVFGSQGKFRIMAQTRAKFGNVTCQLQPVLWNTDFSYSLGETVSDVHDGDPLPSDLFQATCQAANGARYKNIHAGVAWNENIHHRLKSMKRQLETSSERANPTPSVGLSVLMVGIDSVSHALFLRSLPTSRKFFHEVLGGIELDNYNIVGDGTPAALLPILTGQMEEELPEARRGFPGAKHVDGHPWVWKDFKERGYVTAYGEEQPSIGTFQLRMLGFETPPTDHYLRTFQLAAASLDNKMAPLCQGSLPRHVVMLNWLTQLFDMYPDYPKFFFNFFSSLSHGGDQLGKMDSDLADFLWHLETEGHLNSTLLIMMADHGPRFAAHRATSEGRMEERLPYFAFRFPPWFQRQHPDIMSNLQSNSQRLTTPFDIHQTLMELLNFTGTGVADITHRAVSLFQQIPAERKCEDAEVVPHWCARLPWKNVSTSDAVVVRAVQTVVDMINTLTHTERRVCAQLKVDRILHITHFVPSHKDRLAIDKIRQFVVDIPHLGIKYSLPEVLNLYQVSFATEPGGGQFEATCSYNQTSGHFIPIKRYQDISRTNKYGSAAHCIEKKVPHLRPFCYCL